MTQLAWILLLGELLVIALGVALVFAVTTRRRRRKMITALDTLLERLRQNEGQRVEALRQHVATLPFGSGSETENMTARWLASEKAFMGTLVPAFLAEDVNVIDRLDESLHQLLDERLLDLIALKQASRPGDFTTESPVPVLETVQGTTPIVAATPSIDAARYDAGLDLLSDAEDAILVDQAPTVHPAPATVSSLQPETIEAEILTANDDEALSLQSRAVHSQPAGSQSMGQTDAGGTPSGPSELEFWANMGITLDPESSATDTLQAPPPRSESGGDDRKENPGLDAMDAEVWSELKALAQLRRDAANSSAENEPRDSAPGTEQQDQAGASENSTME